MVNKLAEEYEGSLSTPVANFPLYAEYLGQNVIRHIHYLTRCGNKEWLTEKYGKPAAYGKSTRHKLWKIPFEDTIFWVLVSKRGTVIEVQLEKLQPSSDEIMVLSEKVVKFCKQFVNDSFEAGDPQFEKTLKEWQEKNT